MKVTFDEYPSSIKRRLVKFYLCDAFLEDMFLSGTMKWPEGLLILRTEHHYEAQQTLYVAAHASFDEVGEGQEIPLVNAVLTDDHLDFN